MVGQCSGTLEEHIVKLKVFGQTDIGREREENEDAFRVDEEAGLYIVADGMGGLEQGALAAKYTVEGISEQVRETLTSARAINKQVMISDVLRKATKEVSSRLGHAVGNAAGSTVVVARVARGRAWVANLGDSPAYLWRRGSLKKLTRDHNLAALMVEMGKITPQQAKKHPMRHRLTGYVGMEGNVQVPTSVVTLEDKDRILLCTDGLTGMVEEKAMARVLRKETSVEEAVSKLVAMANEVGGHDNITVLLIEVRTGRRMVAK